jgi:hypothetical protein
MRMTEKLGGAKTAVLKGGFFKARNGKEGN